MAKSSTPNLPKYMIEKYIEDKKINWPREMKIANKLIENYSEREFWEQFALDFKLNSLAWFITSKGSRKLNDEYEIFKYLNKIKGTKPTKPANIMDFLQKYV